MWNWQYVPFVTLSTQDNTKLLQQLKSGFKKTIKWDKYQSKVSMQVPNPYLDFLIDPIFQELKRLIVLSFENKDDRTVHTKYYLPAVEINNYNVMVDGKKVFDQPAKNDLRTYDNIQKIAVDQWHHYTTGCLLHYNYSLIITIKSGSNRFSKQQALDADSKAIQQINSTGNLVREGNANTTMLFIIKEAKDTVLDFL